MTSRTTTKRLGRVAAVLALAATTVLGACGGFRQPEVEIENVSVGSIGLSGGTLLVDVAVSNPNGFTLKANQVRYELLLRESGAQADSAWSPFAEGVYDEEISVRGGDTEVFRIPVEFSYRGLGGALGSVMRTGRFDYRARGTVMAQTPFGDREVPFRKTGTMLLSGATVGR